MKAYELDADFGEFRKRGHIITAKTRADAIRAALALSRIFNFGKFTLRAV